MKTLWNRLRRYLRWLVLIVIVLVVIAAVLFWRATIPATPSAFYTPPGTLAAGEPGTIIRSEPITNNVPDGAVAWRILYLTTGVNDEPVAVSGVVVAPAGESATPRPVVAWAHGTVGVIPECGTSHLNDPFKYIPEVDLMVREGFVVAATDYPGLGTPGVHPYLVGPVEAASVLDSVRAARQLDVNAGDRFVVWGGSQGGHATLWTAQSAGTYAPELTLLGAAASAPAIDLPGILQSGFDKRVGAILTSEALYAWSHVYPGVSLDNMVKPEYRERFENVARTCITTPAALLTLGNIPTPSEFLAADPLTTEPYQTLIAENVPDGPIDVPILISHGTGDLIIPFEGSEAEAARRCAAGEDVQFVRYPGVPHDASAESGLMTVGWIEDRFAGRPTGSTCGS
ncbi:MAG: alpha/beta fold hydrolase [Anaerolineae bacterium]|nr:alpha/beta fold hydrolase [Anaerolineae bacterium]